MFKKVKIMVKELNVLKGCLKKIVNIKKMIKLTYLFIFM
jgi:hypothetical protein